MNWEIILLTSVNIFAFGIGNLFTKLATKIIGQRIVVWDAIIYASILLAFFFLYFKGSYHQALNPKAILLQVIASSLYAFGSIVFFFLITKRPAGITITLSSLYPVVSVIAAYFFLKETLNLTQLAGILFALLAIFLLTK